MRNNSKNSPEHFLQPAPRQEPVVTGIGVPGVLLTPSEVAERLQVKVTWVYEHAHEIGVIPVGKYLRFSWPTVLQRLETAATN